MAEKLKTDFENLPQSAQDFIKLVIKNMRYRRSVRLDVQQELAAHFEDELRDCQDQQQRQEKTQKIIEQFGDAKILGILLRRAKKRCRPLWRTAAARTLQGIGVIIVSFIVYVVWFLSGKPAITADYLAELERVTRPAAQENQNATPLLKAAVAKMPEKQKGRDEILETSYADANQSEKQQISEFVNRYTESLDLLSQGTEKPYYWGNYKFSKEAYDKSLFGLLVPDLSEFRTLARVLCLRAKIHADNGQFSKAFEDLLTCYKFGKLIGNGEKSLVEHLVSIAIEASSINTTRGILAKYDIPSQHLAVFQNDLCKIQENQDFGLPLLSEKIFIYDEIQRCFTEDRIGSGHIYLKRLYGAYGVYTESNAEPEPILLLQVMLFHPNKAETKEQTDALFNFFEKMFKMSPAQLHKNDISIKETAEQVIKGNKFLGMLLPAIGNVYRLKYRIKADVQSVPVIIGVLRYKADTGGYPQDLSQLKEAEYINEIPIDPFSDEAIKYKVTDDGFKLYSVGLDFEDDGGTGENSEEEKRRWDEQEDLIFWLVEK